MNPGDNVSFTCHAVRFRDVDQMQERPLHCTRWVKLDPPDRRRKHMTPADTDGELDWDKATRLAYRPAWAIRSRRGAFAPFIDMLRTFIKRT
jgi:hypothetical protein